MLNAIHPAQVAGLFYPAEPDALRTLIREMRKGARSDGGVASKVVVAPHAGIIYSGSIALAVVAVIALALGAFLSFQGYRQ